MPYPVSQPELLAQSSVELSSAQSDMERKSAQLEESHREIEYGEYPTRRVFGISLTDQFHRRMMTMPTVLNDGFLSHRIHERPGYAYVIGGHLPKGKEMTLREAESLKDNFIRSKLGFQSQGDMPPRRISRVRSCRRCRHPSSLRCSACRTSYCSKSCQAKDWKRHVFVCWVKDRPNDVDRLKIMTSRWILAPQDGNTRSALLVALFSDDDLCKTFGFDNCVDKNEVANLICIYGNLVQSLGPVVLQHCVDRRMLGEFIENFISACQIDRSDCDAEYSCFPWFLGRRLTGFDIPYHEGPYAYQVCAMIDARLYFSLDEDAPLAGLSDSEKRVLFLYFILLRDFNNIPDANSAEWIEFGFCYCTSSEQREALAAAYLELAENGTPLGQIANSWGSSSLRNLMKGQGIDISLLDSKDIYCQSPPADEFGIYRLIAEVKHALSGCYCSCFWPRCQFRSRQETLLSRESECDYGLHGSNAWERWQLLNFYSHVFAHPEFDARSMQGAKRNPNPEALDEYLDSLIPNFRRNIWNEYLADAMFPKLKDRVTFPHGRPLYNCIFHTAVTSEGPFRGYLAC